MTKKTLLIGLGVVLGMLTVTAVIWAKGQKERLTLELVWEKEFKEGIDEVCIDSTSAEPSFPIRAIRTEKGIKFFDEKGKVISEIKNWMNACPILCVSENGRYGGIGGPWREYFCKTTFELKDNRGKRIYKIKDVPNRIDISSKGSVVAACHAGGIGGYYSGLEFYNLSGNRIKEVNIDWNGVSSFSKDGSLYAVASFLEKRNESFKGIAGSLVLFTPEGKELWRYPMDNMKIYNIKISDDGRYIACASDDCKSDFSKLISYLYLFNRKGDLLGTYSVGFKECGLLGNDEALAFSPEGKYLAVSDYHNIYFFKTESGEMLWRYQEEVFTRRPDSVSISSNGEYIAVGIAPCSWGELKATRDRYIYFFYNSGQVIMKKNIGTTYAGGVDVKITPNGKQLVVKAGDKTLFFNLK